jgi:signal transduction histidine kinase
MSVPVSPELHDDLNQMASLRSTWSSLDKPPHLTRPTSHATEDQEEPVIETSKEIHRMSYDLHPSKLVYLGLVPRLTACVKNCINAHGLKIEFNHEQVPDDLERDISLCLYRIVQECLNNVIKHSGALEAQVEIGGWGTEIRLRVSIRNRV